jgi:hypothetical protein
MLFEVAAKKGLPGVVASRVAVTFHAEIIPPHTRYPDDHAIGPARD